MSESRRSELRATFDDRLSRSPLDFVRAMDPKGDRTLWLEELTRPIPTDHDLTSVIDLDDLGPTAVFAEILPWDTEFFGFMTARLNAVLPVRSPQYHVLVDLGAAVDDLVDRCRRRGVRYLFATVDARDVALVRALTGSGFELIESRLFYHGDRSSVRVEERYPVRVATPQDADLLARTAAETVNPYDRFHADPIFYGEPADRMMERWVQASIREDFADVTIVPDVNEPEAFVTAKYLKTRWPAWGYRISQAVFSAVSPRFKGWYYKLISETCRHLLDAGAEHVYMVTQATNNAVVHCWEKVGLRFGKNELVLRRWLG